MKQPPCISFSSLLFLWFFSLCLHFLLTHAMSDTFGHNPQHELGNVFAHQSQPLLPYWTVEGDAFANDDFIRLVPDRQSKKGAVWNTNPLHFNNWEIIFRARIHGVSKIGADGLAFWLTDEPGITGDFFGFKDIFRGIGVVIDTYDNDNTGFHPVAMVLLNDGTKKYEHKHEKRQAKETLHFVDGVPPPVEIGSCHFPIRNLANTFLVKVTYHDSLLKVFTDTTGKGEKYDECLAAENVYIPIGYHLGFTAATGHLADNHDLYGFTIRNLDPNAQSIDSQRLHSTHDRYLLSESLSRIQYGIEHLSRKNPQFRTTSLEKIVGNGSIAELTSIKSGVTQVEAIAQQISTALSSIDSKITQGGQQTSLLREIADAKTSLSTIVSKVSRLTSELNKQPEPSCSDSSNFFVIAFVISLLIIGFLGFSLYQVHSEKSKKFF